MKTVEQSEMTQDFNHRYRIVYKETNFFGNQYEIQQRLPFLFFFKRWKGTHLFTHLQDALNVVEHLKTRPQKGEVVYVS